MADTLGGIARLAADPAMQQRVAAAIAQQHGLGLPCPSAADAESSAWAWRLAWAAAPGWAEKYAYAEETGVTSPGFDPAVISDLDIIRWVQQQWTQHDA